MNNQAPAIRGGPVARAAFARLVAQMDEIVGLTQQALLARLEHLAHSATKRTIISRGGKEIQRVETEEPGVQLQAVREALQLRAAYPAKQVELSGAVRVEQLHELALRFESLPTDQLAQIVDAEVAALPPGEAPDA